MIGTLRLPNRVLFIWIAIIVGLAVAASNEYSIAALAGIVITVANPQRKAPWRDASSRYPIVVGYRSGRLLFDHLIAVQRRERTSAKDVWVSQ